MNTIKRWDVFVSHASPDKEEFVLPLADELRSRGIRVWLDRWEIGPGDSISQSISNGLVQSRFGIVVLSPAFFARPWPKKELETLFAQESDGVSHIIPIWHRVNLQDVLKNAPLLADRMAARSDEGIPSIVERVQRMLARDGSSGRLHVSPESVRTVTRRLFPELPVNEFWQAQLLADLDVALYRSVEDIALAYRRARRAVEAFAQEKPELFRSGTDYLTKSLGFVDLCFRSRHNWSEATEDAFRRHADKVDWQLDA